MRTEFRDLDRHRIGRAQVDLAARPTRIATSDTGHEMFLNWDGAVDDAGQLRRCISCGCPDLFQEKIFPQVTGIVVILAFAGAFAGVGEFAGMFGIVTNIPVLTAMVIVLVADVCILLFARKRLICYRCRSSYHKLSIARYHRRWDRSVAERYPAPAPIDGGEPDDGDDGAREQRAAESTATSGQHAPPRPARLPRVMPKISAITGR